MSFENIYKNKKASAETRKRRGKRWKKTENTAEKKLYINSQAKLVRRSCGAFFHMYKIAVLSGSEGGREGSISGDDTDALSSYANHIWGGRLKM